MATSPGIPQECLNKHSDITGHQTDGTGVKLSQTGCSGADLRVSNASLVYETNQSNV